MKRQLGAMLAAGMLLCGSAMWAQSNNTNSSQTGFSGSSQSLFTNSSPSLWTNVTQSGADNTPQSGDPTQAGDTTQAGGDNTQTGSVGPQDTFSHPEQLPALELFSDTISHTGISLNTTAGIIGQHVAVSGFPGYWQSLSSFGAGISLVQNRPTFGLVMDYNGGLNLTGGSSVYSYTELSQTASAQINWNFAKRWQMRLKESYFYSDDPFTPFFTFLGQPTPNNPNPVTYYPQAIIEQNKATLDLTYRLTPHDALNFSGGESFNRFVRGGTSPLYNSVNYTGGVFYQHEFSERLAAGGGYQFAALDFGHGESRAGVQTFEGFITYVFNPRLQASLWLGPELTATKDIVPVFCDQFGCFVETQHQRSWSVAQGGTLDWRITDRDHFSAQVSRGVSSAGGLLGAAQIYQATAAYGRPLTHAWNLGVALNYSNSTSVVQLLQTTSYLKLLTGTFGVSRRLFNDAWNINAYYAFIHQKQNYSSLPATIGTSGLGLTIRYVWAHGIGR
ncbi:MAG TPA: hypothetical protein VFB04_16740 [Terriglobales bacterium]|nr:hypothetical protein [Terriglobales bacterium]